MYPGLADTVRPEFGLNEMGQWVVAPEVRAPVSKIPRREHLVCPSPPMEVVLKRAPRCAPDRGPRITHTLIRKQRADLTSMRRPEAVTKVAWGRTCELI